MSTVRRFRRQLAAFLLLLLFTLPVARIAAAGGAEESGGAEAASGEPAAAGADGPTRLRIGLMPAMNSVPLLVADREGFFADEGLQVELEMFRSQLYRESALQAAEIDGTISDLVNVMNAWENALGVRAVLRTEGVFSLVTSGESGIVDVSDWNARESVETGLVADSIVFYVAERMLEAAGGNPDNIDLVPVVQLPNRVELVAAGRLEAAVLPEPLTWVALRGGANDFLTTELLDETPGVLLFRDEVLEEDPAAVRALVRAYGRGVDAIDADPDAYRAFIAEAASFPEFVVDSMRIPRFGNPQAPSEDLVFDVARWMLAKGLLEAAPEYQDVVWDGLSR